MTGVNDEVLSIGRALYPQVFVIVVFHVDNFRISALKPF